MKYLPRVKRRGIWTVVLALALLALGATELDAQGTEPLLKSDLVRLLGNRTFSSDELADLVRRNCLAFEPTDRDIEQFRALGAGPSVIEAVEACGQAAAAGGGSAEPVSDAYQVSVGRNRVTIGAGSEVALAVGLKRRGRVETGVPVVLVGTREIPGGPGENLRETTDGTGIAIFRVRATGAGTYGMTVVVPGAEEVEGARRVRLTVRPGPAAEAEVRPTELDVDRAAAGPVPVRVRVRDRYGNPVSGQAVTLRPGETGARVPSAVDTTNAEGQVEFPVDLGGVQRPGRLGVYVNGREVGSVALRAGLPAAEGTDFAAGTDQSGRAGEWLPEPLVFEVRGRSGVPIPGQAVGLTGENARLDSTTAVTDSAGRVTVRVRLGERAGTAVVTAVTAGVSRRVTFPVAAGPPAELIVLQEGEPVRNRVTLERPGISPLTVRATDEFGNPVALDRVRSRAMDRGVVRTTVPGIQEDAPQASIELAAIRSGSSGLEIEAAGLERSLRVDVMLPGAQKTWSLAARGSFLSFKYDFSDRPEVGGEDGFGFELMVRRMINRYVSARASFGLGSLGARFRGNSRSTSLQQGYLAVEGTPFPTDRIRPTALAGFGRYHLQTDEFGAGLKHTSWFYMVGAGLDVAISRNVTYELRVAFQQLLDTGIEGQEAIIGSLVPVGMGVRFGF